MSSLILTKREGAVTTATLNRPEKRNALNVALLEQLCAEVAAAESDAAQRVFVLRGAGAVFSSGMDLIEAADPQVAAASAELIGRTLGVLAATRLITIAAVQGAAIA